MKTLRKRIGALLCAAALVLTLLPGAAMAAGSPADGTDNTGSTYNGSWAVPVPSYLYQDGENLVRVEYDQGWHIYQANGDVTTVRPEQIIVESYSPQFQLLESRTMELELPLWGGFYAGADYNFLVFGQENPTENDSTEVIRVVKYDKDWNRLGQASLYDINTTVPFEAGSLRMDEYGGYLYVRTSHEMYTSSDGLNHQANLTFSVREADMAVTDSYSGVANTSAGYVSHSFNQFILVDEQGNIVTLDHGDGFPRGAVLMRYDAKAGEDLFITASGTHWLAVSDEVIIRSWPGGVGENTTGAQVTGLAETATGYLTAFSDTGKGAASRIGADVGNVYLSCTPKDNFTQSATTVRQVTNFSASSSEYGSQPRLVPTGLDGGYILWDMAAKEDNGYFYDSGTLQYARYSADGTVSAIQTAENAPLFNGQPIVYNGQVVWYVTQNSAPTFYTLDESGVTAHPTQGAAEEPEQPDPSTGSAFSDVPATHWACSAIEEMAERGVMNGIGGGKFNPGGTVTNGEFFAMLVRAFYPNALARAEAQYSDGEWWLPATIVANDAGLLYSTQYGSLYDLTGTWQADLEIDRVYMAAAIDVLLRNAGITADQAQKTAARTQIGDWEDIDSRQRDAVATVYALGVIRGDDQGNFRPEASMTRAEAAVVMQRLLALGLTVQNDA